MTDLQELMHQNVAEPPHDGLDLAVVLDAGRRRARARRRGVVGAAASATAAVTVLATVIAPGFTGHGPHRSPGPAGGPSHGVSSAAPVPRGTLHLSDAEPAVLGRDYRVLASVTNHDVATDGGENFDGVTADGKVLLQYGPSLDRPLIRYALLDPATGVKEPLPDLGIGEDDTVPVELGAHRLVLVSQGGVLPAGPLIGHVFDRDTGQWSTTRWPGLPDVAGAGGVMGPDGRIYVTILASRGTIPQKWPLGRDQEADDSGASGDTYHLWSVSPTDSSDVRDEGMSVGSIVFTPTSMVWTDRTNGAAGLVHVRTLATREENSFDPHVAPGCNVLGLSATADRVVLDEYCGESSAGVRDDRVQILTTDGDPVATIQDNGTGGGIFALGGDDDVVTIFGHAPGSAGTYVYDLATGRFLRISHGIGQRFDFGTTRDREFTWVTPADHGQGATQRVGQLLP